VQTLKNMHARDRVSDIVIRGPNAIYSASCGRSGCLNRYAFMQVWTDLALYRAWPRLDANRPTRRALLS
jgi:hypothetical protein